LVTVKQGASFNPIRKFRSRINPNLAILLAT
jgi:hypothetical protein